jgi:hypothetical protein
MLMNGGTMSKKKNYKKGRERIHKLKEEELHEALGWPKDFPFDEKPVPGLFGKLYQWLKNRYFKNRRPWNRSDVILWKFWCVVAPIWFGYILWATIFYWLFGKIYENYGIGRLIAAVAVIGMWRVAIATRALGEANKKLDELNKRFGGS